MILTCSTCSTRYSIDPTSIGPEGRAVKCAKCGHKWREFPPGDMPKTIDAAKPAENELNDPPRAGVQGGLSIEQMTAGQAPSPSRTGGRKWIGWGLLLLILAGLVISGFYARNYIVQIWPGAAGFYQFLKIDVETKNVLGLEIHDLKTKSVLQKGVTTLTVTGIIKNITEEPQPTPRIKVALIDGKDQLVYSWTTTVEEREVPAWGEIAFSTSMNQPPEDAKNVKVDLVELGK
ncbi:DUF3426 domain-containing protein [Sneathiella sp.]|uniref:DUF3426 domain-containing protein n=1 Tax=Sneathiella sp. TaxID=1964365 RepID=UPI003569B535